MIFCRLFSTRPECTKLRRLLIHKYSGNYHCSMCMNAFPFPLLDMAHIKPRHTLTSVIDRKNIHNVEFMCKMCHAIYDQGFIGVNSKGIIESKHASFLSALFVVRQIGNVYSKYSDDNAPFFNWHYHHIFNMKHKQYVQNL